MRWSVSYDPGSTSVTAHSEITCTTTEDHVVVTVRSVDSVTTGPTTDGWSANAPRQRRQHVEPFKLVIDEDQRLPKEPTTPATPRRSRTRRTGLRVPRRLLHRRAHV